MVEWDPLPPNKFYRRRGAVRVQWCGEFLVSETSNPQITGHSLNTLIAYFHTVHPTFDIHLDGRMVAYGFDVTLLGTSNSTDTREADTNAQIITGGAPGDHQLLLRTTAPVNFLLTAVE